MLLVLNDGTEMHIGHDGFLTRWLFEDFEQEVKEGRVKYQEREKVRKAKLKEKSEQDKIKQKFLIETAKAKLSKEELAALKKGL